MSGKLKFTQLDGKPFIIKSEDIRIIMHIQPGDNLLGGCRITTPYGNFVVKESYDYCTKVWEKE